MLNNAHSLIIEHTQTWIKNVVMGCNFCPFAAKEFNANTIRYRVLEALNSKDLKQELLAEFKVLDKDEKIATTLLIFPNQYLVFRDFLDTLADAEDILVESDYEGIYQLASFHPEYLFAGEHKDSPTHYTNRSPYAMMHILREEMLEKAIDSYPYPTEVIPDNNIKFTNQKGIEYMKALWVKSFK